MVDCDGEGRVLGLELLLEVGYGCRVGGVGEREVYAFGGELAGAGGADSVLAVNNRFVEFELESKVVEDYPPEAPVMRANRPRMSLSWSMVNLSSRLENGEI